MDLIIKIALVVLVINTLSVTFFAMWIAHYIINDFKNDELYDEIKLLTQKNEYEKLKDKCEKNINSSNKLIRYYAHYGLALQEIKLTNYIEAEELLGECIRIIPTNLHSYYKLIEIKLILKEPSRAYYYVIQAFDNSVFPDSNFFTYVGMLFTANEEYDDAIKIFEMASKKDSKSPMPIIGIAIAHYLNKNNNKAIDFIREARNKINPNNSSHTEINEWAKGLLAIMHGDFKEAHYIFEYYRDSSNFGPIFDLILQRIKIVFNPER